MADQVGLQELEARRRRTRQVPKPQHTKANVTGEEPPVPEAPVEAMSARTEEVAPPSPIQAVDTAATPTEPAPSPPRRRSRLRQTQVHLDDRADGHLTELKKRAVMGEVDLSASAVLRQALNEYVERHGYDGIVAWFAEHGR